MIDDPRVTQVESAGIPRGLADGANLVAGTSWVWVSTKLSGSVDVLFVDEAGQISLANVVAVSAAARNIVLLGDPQQLDQPLQGTHPPGAEQSALAHVLDGLATMPPDRGLFLETTWRLHPDLCEYTSEVFYDSRLEPEAHLAEQLVRSVDTVADGTGTRMLAIPTVGADNENPEEAEAVAGLVTALVEGGTTWTPAHGTPRPLTLDDVLVVAPVQRPGRRDQATAPGGRSRGDRGQVPGPGSADQHLLAHDLGTGARATGPGLPVQPAPTECRDLEGSGRRHRRGVAGPVPGPGPDPGTDAPRERVLPLRRDGGETSLMARPYHRPS